VKKWLPQFKLKYNRNGEAVQLANLTRLKLEQFTVAFGVLFVGHFLVLLQLIREHQTVKKAVKGFYRSHKKKTRFLTKIL